MKHSKNSQFRRYNHFLFIVSLWAIGVFVLGPNANGVPAYPFPVATIQPDGTEIFIRKTGDEYSHSVEDLEGYTILQDDISKQWVYADMDTNGKLAKTAYVVGKGIPSFLKGKRHLKSDADGSRRIQRMKAMRGSVSTQKTLKKGTVKNLVLLVAFKNKPFTYAQTDFNKLFNEKGYSVGGAHGSVKDYYAEVSYGQISMESVIAGPVTLSRTYDYYGANDSGGSDKRPREMIEEALDLLSQTGFDFSQVDGDGDGWVDGFDVIHSGYDEAAYGDPNCIWSHNWVLSSAKTYGGVKFQTYHTEAELYERNGKKGITAIGVPCHETGHFLGLPDLYDVDYSSAGIGRFCLMSGGSWCDNGLRPAHMSAWCKVQLGWVAPTTLSAAGQYSLPRVEDNPTIYKLQGELPSNEYFLLENRQGCLFDSALPGDKRGMLVWHIDSSVGSLDRNDINDNPLHFGVDLEEASGKQDLEGSSKVYGDDFDYFRGDTMSSFTSKTTPNTGGYSGGKLGIDITRISDSGSTMTFVLSREGNGVDISPLLGYFTAAADKGSFSVTANSAWTASTPDSWITLKTTSGSGSGTVSYTIDINPNPSERTGTITVSDKDGAKATHTIKQSGESTKLNLSPPEADFGNDADEGSFAVSANCVWTASVPATASWITLDITSGSGNDTVTYSVDKNSGAARSCTITIKSANGTQSATHQVTQAAQPTLNISPSSATVAATVTDGSFSVSSDSMWTVTKSDAWITLQTTEGNGNGTVRYSVLRNTGERRMGYIYVKSGNVKRTYTVTQRCANIVTFSENSVAIPAGGGTGTVTATVLADGSSTVLATSSYSGDWISWTRSDATVTDGSRYTYSWTAEANTSGIARQMSIDVVLNGTAYSCTLVQDPAAGSYRVTYRPGAYGNGSEISVPKQAGGILMLKGAIYTRDDGYAQKGWATADGGGKVYDLMGFYTEDKSIVLYPYWEVSTQGGTTYTVTFAPGRYGNGDYQTATKTKGVALALPGALFTRDGYKQAGWGKDWSGASKTHELGGTFTTDEDTKLYPYWEEIQDNDDRAYDIGFCAPDGWEQPMCLSKTNLAAGVYAPQYVFKQGDGLVLNYCVANHSDTSVTFDDRHASLLNDARKIVNSEIESETRTISYNSYMRFRNRDYSGWLSSLAPGNYAIEIWLDPYDKLHDPDRSNNRWREWFAVEADGITFNEALDCNALEFIKDSEGAAVFAQTSESVSGGSCVQFGPQATNCFDGGLWAQVTGPGTLSFKWKATSQDDQCAYLALYVDGNLTNYIWAAQETDWQDVSIATGEGSHWVNWVLGTYGPDASHLTAGWVDCVSWSAKGGGPTFTVDANGTLTGVTLNGATDIVIPSEVNGTTVRAIGAYVLTNTAITSVSIPGTVTSIEKFAFYNNPCLVGVTIPGSVRYIYESAFNACTGLKSVILEEGVRAIGNYAFYNCSSLTDIRIPASVTLIEQSPFGQCPNLRTIAVAPGNTIYSVRDTALVDAYNTLIQYPSGRPESEYTIPDGITAVGYDAFDTVPALKKVRIPAGVASLGRFAFWQCSNLATVEFLGDAPTVGDNAFHGVAASCTAQVSPRSMGWGVSIPGSWQGLAIAYSQDLVAYQVCYAPGSNGRGASQTVTKPHGGSLKLSGALFTRTGHEQTGWSLADGGALAYDLGAIYAVDADVTLYPFWTAAGYSVGYNLDGGVSGTSRPMSATYDKAFCVSAPSREGYAFTGWLVAGDLDSATARYGVSSGDLSCTIAGDGQRCFNGEDDDVWFINLSSISGKSVTLTATWESVDDGSRDIGFYAPASKGWQSPAFLSTTNIEYLVYMPETEFKKGATMFLSFCAVNWNRSGTAILQSTRLTFTDEKGNVVEQGEPIQRYTLPAFGYQEFRDIPLDRYLERLAPGKYKLTAELDPNEFLDDPDRSNNTTSIWFTLTAQTEPFKISGCRVDASNQTLTVRFAAVGGKTYQLEHARTLDGEWVPVKTVTLEASGERTIGADIAEGWDSGFYRMKELE